MRYTLRYLPKVEEDVRHLAPDLKKIIHSALDELSQNPQSGTPLKRELGGFWKYRAKRYRIIYEIHSQDKEMVVFLIDERQSVYDRLREILKNRLRSGRK